MTKTELKSMTAAAKRLLNQKIPYSFRKGQFNWNGKQWIFTEYAIVKLEADTLPEIEIKVPGPEIGPETLAWFFQLHPDEWMEIDVDDLKQAIKEKKETYRVAGEKFDPKLLRDVAQAAGSKNHFSLGIIHSKEERIFPALIETLEGTAVLMPQR